MGDTRARAGSGSNAQTSSGDFHRKRNEAEAHRKAWDTRGRGRRAESEALGEWSRDGKWTFNDSEEARNWGAGKSVAPGDVPVPFPVWTEAEQAFVPGSKAHWHGKRPINKQEPVPRAVKAGTMKVKLSDLIATQHVVTETSVRRGVLQFQQQQNTRMRSNPVVVRYHGKSFIWDGHHRASAAKVMGLDEIEAEVFDID